jgi:hypothetical protein
VLVMGRSSNLRVHETGLQTASLSLGVVSHCVVVYQSEVPVEWEAVNLVMDEWTKLVG